MQRALRLSFLLFGLVAAAHGQPISPEEPPGEPAAERTKLEARARALFREGQMHVQPQRLPEAERCFREPGISV